MRPRTALLCSAAAGSLVLTACGADEQSTQEAATTSVAGSSPAGSPAAPSTLGGQAGPGSTEADLSLDDQSGPGDSLTVARVVVPAAGYVVVTADDGDDDADDDRVLGVAAVPVGESRDVVVPLSPALTEDTDVEAALYADSDGDGSFDPAVDQRMPASAGDDGDDEVSEDADYDVL